VVLDLVHALDQKHGNHFNRIRDDMIQMPIAITIMSEPKEAMGWFRVLLKASSRLRRRVGG
jgi:hypothetical protein